MCVCTCACIGVHGVGEAEESRKMKSLDAGEGGKGHPTRTDTPIIVSLIMYIHLITIHVQHFWKPVQQFCLPSTTGAQRRDKLCLTDHI